MNFIMDTIANYSNFILICYFTLTLIIPIFTVIYTALENGYSNFSELIEMYLGHCMITALVLGISPIILFFIPVLLVFGIFHFIKECK